MMEGSDEGRERWEGADVSEGGSVEIERREGGSGSGGSGGGKE